MASRAQELEAPAVEASKVSETDGCMEFRIRGIKDWGILSAERNKKHGLRLETLRSLHAERPRTQGKHSNSSAVAGSRIERFRSTCNWVE